MPGADENEAAGDLRVPEGEFLSGRTAPGVANDVRAVDPEGLQQRGRVVGHIAHREALGR